MAVIVLGIGALHPQSVRYKTGYLQQRSDFSIKPYIIAGNGNSVVGRIIARDVVAECLALLN